MNRELKFRIYSFLDKSFIYFDIYNYPSGIAGGVSEPQQYTGLKDKNNKEIYEVDIVKVQNYRSHIGQNEVEFYGDHDQLVVKWWKSGIWNIARNDIFNSSCLYEVVGNIFENPELLKNS